MPPRPAAVGVILKLRVKSSRSSCTALMPPRTGLTGIVVWWADAKFDEWKLKILNKIHRPEQTAPRLRRLEGLGGKRWRKKFSNPLHRSIMKIYSPLRVAIVSIRVCVIRSTVGGRWYGACCECCAFLAVVDVEVGPDQHFKIILKIVNNNIQSLKKLFLSALNIN